METLCTDTILNPGRRCYAHPAGPCHGARGVRRGSGRVFQAGNSITVRRDGREAAELPGCAIALASCSRLCRAARRSCYARGGRRVYGAAACREDAHHSTKLYHI